MNLTLRIAAAASLILPGLAFLPTAQADLTPLYSSDVFSPPSPDLVNPLDTFNVAVTAFDANGANGVFLVSPLTPTFGLTQTFAGTGATAGQTITITSSESVGVTTTTDVITLSVPTNFAPAGVTGNGGATLTRLSFELGRNNAGTNTLDFTLPVSSPTYAGSVLYSTNTTFTLTPAPLLTNNSQSLSNIEGVSTGTTAINGFNFRSFTFSVTYATVPEPSTWAMVVLGAGVCLWGTARRRRQLAQ